MKIELLIGISFIVGALLSAGVSKYYWSGVFRKWRDEMHRQYQNCLKEMEKKYKNKWITREELNEEIDEILFGENDSKRDTERNK